MFSRVPNHPVLKLPLLSQQASVTTEEDSTHAGRSRVEKRKTKVMRMILMRSKRYLVIAMNIRQIFKLAIINLEINVISY